MRHEEELDIDAGTGNRNDGCDGPDASPEKPLRLEEIEEGAAVDSAPAEPSDTGFQPPEGSETAVPVVVVGVRQRPGWPIGHYSAGAIFTSDGEWVLIQTEHGTEVGQVVGGPARVDLPPRNRPPRVLGLASTHDIEVYYQNLAREKEAWEICSDRIGSLGLAMKLVRVERYFDQSKIVFYYFADSRIDFRELVKDLVKALKTRVEMRQIGIRHEAKMLGGIGGCGRTLCCATFLKDFDPISIKMAKAQNLPLNPGKISGVCGRLLCCLTYEYNTYLELKKEMPALGKSCDTPAGEGKVVRHNILKQTVTVELPGGTLVEYDTEQLARHKMRAETGPSAPEANEAGAGTSVPLRGASSPTAGTSAPQTKRRGGARQARAKRGRKGREGTTQQKDAQVASADGAKRTDAGEVPQKKPRKRRSGRRGRSRSAASGPEGTGGDTPE